MVMGERTDFYRFTYTVLLLIHIEEFLGFRTSYFFQKIHFDYYFAQTKNAFNVKLGLESIKLCPRNSTAKKLSR